MTLLDAFEQFVEVGHGAELGHDFAVIANVVSVVGVGRVVMRAQPDHVDPEALDVVKLGDDAFEIAYAVAVGVFERAWVDLVDNGLFPPLWLVTIDSCRGVVLSLNWLVANRRTAGKADSDEDENCKSDDDHGLVLVMGEGKFYTHPMLHREAIRHGMLDLARLPLLPLSVHCELALSCA